LRANSWIPSKGNDFQVKILERGGQGGGCGSGIFKKLTKGRDHGGLAKKYC
jgi:hypothetical protein